MEQLTGLDARFLYSESPAAHMHTLKIAVVDLSGRATTLDPATFLTLMRAALDRLPLLRLRAIPVPLRLSHPMWVEDPDFDLARHLRWRRAPQPGGDRELAAIVSEIAGTPLPRDRPLWDLTVVEGLADGQVGFVMKIHHALADGGAAVALLENVFAASDDDAYVRSARPEALPSRRALMAQALRSWVPQITGFPRFVSRSVKGLRAAREMRRESEVALPALFSANRSTLNRALDAERTFAMTALPLDALRAVRTHNDATFNDVFLAVCGGALHRYLARQGEAFPGDLITGVPIATRRMERRFSGNHVDNLVLPLGVQLDDPVERLHLIRDASGAAIKIRQALDPELFEYRAGLTPPLLYPLTIRLWARSRLADRVRPPISLIASNVRGPAEPLELNGGIITDLYSVGPILEGVGLNITAWSYAGRLLISVIGCRNTLPDPWELIEDLDAASAELVAAVRT